MCGLVGVAGDVTLLEKNIFNEMLFCDVLRGSHGTGIALIKNDKNSTFFLHKDAVPSTSFMGTKEYKDVINETNSKCIIGHNRYATIGAKTAENSHPFEFKNLVGAHNGTIDNWSLKHLEGSELFGTDSEALLDSIHKYGLKESIVKFLVLGHFLISTVKTTL